MLSPSTGRLVPFSLPFYLPSQPSQVELVWERRWGLGTALFVFNRYSPFVESIISLSSELPACTGQSHLDICESPVPLPQSPGLCLSCPDLRREPVAYVPTSQMCRKLTAVFTCKYFRAPLIRILLIVLLHRVYRVGVVDFGVRLDAPNVCHLGSKPQGTICPCCNRNRSYPSKQVGSPISHSLLACIGVGNCLHGDGTAIHQV